MASLLESLRNLGRSVLATVSDGAARAVSSFAERVDRHNSLVCEQRAHLPRGARGRLAREHLTGERAFSSMMRRSGALQWPGDWRQNRAMQVTFFRRWVYVFCDRICSTVASLPPQLGYVRARKRKQRGAGNRVEKSGISRQRKRAYYEARCRKTLGAVKPHEEIKPVPDDHPLARLLKKPNAWDKSPGQLWYELVLFLLLTGSAYVWMVPNELNGAPMELWVIPSHWVLGPKLGPAGEQEYWIIPYVGGAGKFTLPADEVIPFHFKNPLNKLAGQSPIQAIAPWIDVSESIDDSRYWTFKNGSQATGAIELGPKYDPDDPDLEAIGAKLLARLQGERNAGMIPVLPPDMKMVPLTIAAKDMAYEGGFEQLRDALGAAFAVPKGIAGITDPGSDRALWGERAIFYEQAILPRLRYIGETFTATGCRRWDDELVMYWPDPTPSDPQQVNADLGVDFQHFLRTPNEGRALRGLEPIDNPLMDEVWLPPNMQPLSIVEATLKQQMQQQAAMQQQATMQQQPAAAPDQQESEQQQSQGFGGEQEQAEDAALDVNDAAWQSDQAAVQKAHEYNQRFEKAGNRWRLTQDGGHWKAHNPSTNGDGHEELMAAAKEFLTRERN